MAAPTKERSAPTSSSGGGDTASEPQRGRQGLRSNDEDRHPSLATEGRAPQGSRPLPSPSAGPPGATTTTPKGRRHPHPHHPHGYDISPPTTTGDKGLPTPDVLRDAERVFELMGDERHLVAHKLLMTVRERVLVWTESGMTKNGGGDGTTGGGGGGSSSYGMSRRQYKRIRRTSKRVGTNRRRSDGGGGAAAAVSASFFASHSGGNGAGGTTATPSSTTGGPVYDSSVFEDDKYAKAKALLDSKEHEIETLENRCRLFRQAQRNLATDDDWIHASHHFGIHTYYRREESGSLSIKLEGTLEGVSLFEQICVLKEVDLHHTWAPFCCSSMTIADLDKLDQVGWFLVGLPNFGLARDGCFRAIGCDNIEEDGTILMTAQGIHDHVEPTIAASSTASSVGSVTSMGGADRYLADDPLLQQLDIPPVPKRRGVGRMTIHKLEAMIQIKSPTSATTRIVANVNPNIPYLPVVLLDFIMKHMAGVLLGKLQAAARKIGKNPKTNVHAQRMRAEARFYRDWLLVKLQNLCKEKGWEMPPVSVFDYMEHDEARLGRGRDLLRVRTYSGAAVDHDGAAENWSSDGTPPNVEDELSELSSQPGSNPSSMRAVRVRKFFSEFENRAKQKKELKIAEERRRAAELLKPKELPSYRRERLFELKSAVEARKRLGSADYRRSRSALDDGPMSSISEIMTDRLNEHDLLTRVLVVASLMILLFVMLHPLTVVRLPSYLPVPVMQDAGVVAYLLLCGVVHFALCDVALVYAFSSLDVGQKAGREVKLFYSANVRMAVAGVSLFIFSISFMTALAKVVALATLRSAFRLTSRLLETAAESGASLWTALSGILSVSRQCLEPVFYVGKAVASVVLSSNSVGRTTIRISVKAYALVYSVLDDVSAQCRSMLRETEDELQPHLPWRVDAFDTAKALFMNSAVFLLTILIIFHLSTRRLPKAPLRAAINGTVVDDTDRTADDPAVPKSFVATRAATQASTTSRRPRANTSHDAIPENESVHSPGVTSDDASQSSRSKFRLGSRTRSWTAPEARLLRKFETR